MGRITNVSTGAISGKVGPAVYYEMSGVPYVRAAPRPRAKGAWSAPQKMVRQKVVRVAALWRQLDKNPLREVWKLGAQNMTAYNLFLKTNLPAFKGEGLEADYEFLHLSTGPLPLPHQLVAVKMEGDASKRQVSWKDDSGYMLSQPTDELMVVFAREGKFSHPVATGARRSQEAAVVQVPEEMANLKGIYLYFASPKRGLYSVDQFVEV